MKIRSKILLPTLILVVAGVAALLVSNILQFSRYVDKTYEDSVNTASAVAVNHLATLEMQAKTVGEYLASDSALASAVEEGDREAILSCAARIQNETNIEFCTITDAEGNVLARSHDPGNFGDSVSSQANIQSALSGRGLTTIEQGTAVRLSVRSGEPVYGSDGSIVGAASVGFRLDQESFVDSIKDLVGCEVTVFLGDERISTTVVKDDGARAVGTKADSGVSGQVLGGTAFMGEANILGQSAIAKYTPIRDADGKVLGMLFVGNYTADKTTTVRSFVFVGLIICAVLLIISIVVMMIITKRITGPINSMVSAARSLAAGDTDISLDVRTKDETLELANAFNEMIVNTRGQVEAIEAIANGDLTVSAQARSDKDVMNRALQTMLGLNNEVFSRVVDSANQVSDSADLIANSSQVLAQGATEQAATVQQLSAAIGEVAVQTNASAALAANAAELAEEIRGNATKGSEQMEQMVQAVREINEESKSISNIIKVIDDIAFQTNILALNAAVEAARAGQHGKGFAVVADEVRSLAAKSADAAKDTGALITGSMQKAEFGARVADETAESLDRIVEGIIESGRIVGEISKSSEQQSAAIGQINDGVNQVSQVVQQNSATSQESAAASEEMSSQAKLLQELVSRFRLKGEQETAAYSVLETASVGRNDSYGDFTADYSGNLGKY